MTIGVNNRNDGLGNGSTGTYPYGFKIFAASDLRVTVRDPDTDEETTLTYPTHYTVTGVGNRLGGNVVLAGTGNPWQDGSGFLDTGWAITARRVRPLTQATDIRNQGGFFADTHEDKFDDLTMIDQQQQDEIDRALKLSETVDASVVSAILPAPEASAFLSWNSLGTAIINAAGMASVAVSSAWAAVVGSATLATGRAAMGFSAYFDTLIAAATAAALRILLLARGPADYVLVNGYIDWSVSGNVLTVAIKTLAGTDPTAADPVYVAFRSATATDGSNVVRTITGACSININNTATLGTSNSTAFRLWAVLFDDAGTVRMGLINCLSGMNIYPLAGFGIASSTQEGDSADSAHVFYTDGAGVASKAYAVAGYATWETGLASAGVWAAGPTRQQLFVPGVPLPGQVIQSARTETGAVATGTTLIPSDDTIPQITEGDQYLSRAITPTSAANVLDVLTSALSTHSAASYNIIAALFRDSGADAIGVYRNYGAATSAHANSMIKKSVLCGSVSATTFTLRIGGNTAGTVTFNGAGGTRAFGGAFNSFMEVEEIMT